MPKMDITVEELRALADTGATILNVGKHGGHREIRGAVRYRPHDLLTPDHLAIPIAPDKPVILYDEHGDGDLTKQVAEKLQANAFKDVRILQGGFSAWEEADGPTQEPSIEQVVPPTRPSQVQELDRRI
jgi:3-mercaptopyruvate sulfurtransferase SseA